MKWALRIILGIAALLVVSFLLLRTPDTDPAEMRAKYGGEPSQFVEIGDGVTVHLRDEGPQDGIGDTPPILLLHGSNADLHTWQPWVEGLSDSHRVIRFDQVGHGLTGPDPEHDYSLDSFTADIDEVAEALGLERFILGGNSMGGKHALAYAIRYPEKIEGLILVDSSGPPILEEDEEEDDGGNIGFAIAMTPGINKIAEQITPRALIAQSLEETVSVKSVVTEEAIDRYWELLRYPGNRAATMTRFSTEYAPLDADKVSGISVPTLILWGDEDRLIPVSAGEWLDEKLPESQLIVYSGIGHLPQEEAPEASLTDVKQWLSRFESEPEND